MVSNGSVEFTPSVDFHFLIHKGEISEFFFAVRAEEKSSLEFETKIQKTLIKKEFPLGKPVVLGQIVAMVGPVPIVLIPVLTFQVGIDGSVHVGIVSRVDQTLQTTAGAHYVDRRWQPVAAAQSEFSYLPPTLHAGLDFKGYAGSRVSLLLYGVAGPFASIGPYLKLEADTSKRPWWELYGGLEVPVGVRVDLLGYKTIADYTVVAVSTKRLLAQAPVGKLLGKIVFLSARDFGRSDGGWPLGYDLYAMNPDGSELVRLTRGSAVGYLSSPAVSPDGTQMLVGYDKELRLFSQDGALLKELRRREARCGCTTGR